MASPPSALAEIDATIHRIRYQHATPSFTVLSAWDRQRQPITLAGPIDAALCVPYQTLRCLGQWTTHPRYGKQFVVQAAHLAPPDTPRALSRYLKASHCPQLGPTAAQRLVTAFGADTLTVLRTDPARVAQLPKISLAKAQRWQAFFQAQMATEAVLAWCVTHQIDPQLASSLARTFGIDTLDRLNHNPYLLCRDPWHVPFPVADAITFTQAGDPITPLRLRALWAHLLVQASTAGHTVQSTASLRTATQRYLRRTHPTLTDAAIDDALHTHILAGAPSKPTDLPWVYTPDTDQWALSSTHWQELQLAVRLLGHLRNTPPRPCLPSHPDVWESLVGTPYTPQQHTAVVTCLQQPFTCLTGGPGTGKTTIIQGLVAWLQDQAQVAPDAIALAAPTAQAAQRLSAVTGHPATTIHRLLEWDPQGFTYTSNHPLPHSWIIIDEVSMLDLPLAQAFWDAVPAHAHVIWVGDVDQLPSVGPGAILRDCLNEPRIPHLRLTANFRADAPLTHNAHRILQGQRPTPNAVWTWHEFPRSTPATRVQRTLLAYLDRLTQSMPWESIHVLTGIHHGPLGTDTLNALLRDHWNPAQPDTPEWPAAHHRTYRLHDRVMQLHNDRHRNIFNGEVGYITTPPPSHDPDEADADNPPILWVRFPYHAHPVPYTWLDTQWLTWAYCSTVHKAQALEYPVVCALVFWDQGRLLYRNLLYTAVTRAQTRVLILSESGAIEHAIATTDPHIRQTGLPAAFQRWTTSPHSSD